MRHKGKARSKTRKAYGGHNRQSTPEDLERKAYYWRALDAPPPNEKKLQRLGLGGMGNDRMYFNDPVNDQLYSRIRGTWYKKFFFEPNNFKMNLTAEELLFAARRTRELGKVPPNAWGFNQENEPLTDIEEAVLFKETACPEVLIARKRVKGQTRYLLASAHGVLLRLDSAVKALCNETFRELSAKDPEKAAAILEEIAKTLGNEETASLSK